GHRPPGLLCCAPPPQAIGTQIALKNPWPRRTANTKEKSMTVLDFLVLLLVAAVCGIIGQVISGNYRGGILVSIALGFIRALLGVWIARNLGLPEPFPLVIHGTQFPIVWSIIGCALFMVVLGLFQRPSFFQRRRRWW